MSGGGEVWVSLGRHKYGDAEVLIREWRPGDGTHCAFARMQRKEPCGPPVAVQDTLNLNPSSLPARIRRNICAEHLAGQLTTDGKTRRDAIAKAEKVAREAVVAAHWDEYKAAYTAELDRQRDELLGAVPEAIRDVLRAAWDRDDEADQ